MVTVNRHALVVKAKQPFLDWVNSVETTSPKVTFLDLEDDSPIYLLREGGMKEDIADMVKEVYKEIFADQLAAWFTDEETWPQDRSFSAFRRWFDWQSHSIVVDLSKKPLSREAD